MSFAELEGHGMFTSHLFEFAQARYRSTSIDNKAHCQHWSPSNLESFSDYCLNLLLSVLVDIVLPCSLNQR